MNVELHRVIKRSFCNNEHSRLDTPLLAKGVQSSTLLRLQRQKGLHLVEVSCFP